MIARLRGEIVEKGTQSITVDVHGVGYAVAVADERYYTIQQTVDLHIYLHWNQEQGPHLYGFTDAFSKTVFASILSCSGCGPKIGLAILVQLRPEEFIHAIMSSNKAALSGVNGIGPKKAELMIMQLKDKVVKMVPAHSTVNKQESLVKIRTVHEALAALRYKPSEIAGALEYLHTEPLETSSVDELLRKGLAFLAKRV